MSTAMLMQKLMQIDAACSPQRQQKAQEDREKNLDEFTIEKRRMAEFIREIRADIKERDKIYQDNPQDSKGVVKGAEIRTKIREAIQKGEELDKLYKSKHKKLKIPGTKNLEAKKAKDENRKQIVDLMHQHIAELQKQEKHVRVGGDRALISESDESDSERDATGLGIPDIDDQRFELLKKNDQEIDEMLDVTLQGVKRLKQLAMEIGGAVDESNNLIAEVQTMADTTLGKLETVNGQLKKTLEAARSKADCCCDIILCVIILGIATAIYFVATKN